MAVTLIPDEERRANTQAALLGGDGVAKTQPLQPPQPPPPPQPPLSLQPRPPRRRWPWVVLVVLLLAGAALAFAQFVTPGQVIQKFLNRKTDTSTVAVPHTAEPESTPAETAETQEADRTRKDDLADLKSALGEYFGEHDVYPHELGELAPLYLDAVPKDPDGSGYLYEPAGCSEDGCSAYRLSATLDNPNDPEAEDGEYILDSVSSL